MSGATERHLRAVEAATAQAGVLSHEQLVGVLGWPRSAVRAQLEAHRWQRVFDGVYAVFTGELSMSSLWWAAHLRCGDGSALSHDSALQAWQIQSPSQPIEIAVPRTSSARTPGLILHRMRAPLATRSPRALPPAVVPQLALLMVSNRLEPVGVMDLMSSACQKGKVSADQIERAMREIRVKHRKLIIELLTEIRGGATTPLEIDGVRNILKAHGLPLGQGQVRERINGKTVFRDRVVHGLLIEFDGRLGHADPDGRFRDQSRDNAAVLTGRPSLRFGWKDVHEAACEAADQVIGVLELMGVTTKPVTCPDGCRSQFVARRSRG